MPWQAQGWPVLSGVGALVRPASAVPLPQWSPSPGSSPHALAAATDGIDSDEASELPMCGVQVATSTGWRTLSLARPALVQARPAPLDSSAAALPQTVALRNAWQPATARSCPPLVSCGARALTRQSSDRSSVRCGRARVSLASRAGAARVPLRTREGAFGPAAPATGWRVRWCSAAMDLPIVFDRDAEETEQPAQPDGALTECVHGCCSSPAQRRREDAQPTPELP